MCFKYVFCCVDLICSVVVLIVHVWGCGGVVMFQSIPLCVQPTGSTNAETFHSGIWQPPIARNASIQNTCSDLHCHRISRNMVVASGGDKPPIRVEFKMVVASCVLFTQCPASCPRLRQEKADINVYIRQNLHQDKLHHCPRL